MAHSGQRSARKLRQQRLSAEIRAELAGRAYCVIDSNGKPYVDLWLRKSTPASGKPAGARGRVQFPMLADGTLLGAVRYRSDGQDFRDQTIAAEVYTLRYGLQPLTDAHARQSPFRDFALLLPAAEDSSPAALPRKLLEEKSADASGSTHPAVLTLLAVEQAGLRIVEDEANHTRGVVVPLALTVKGEPMALDVQIIITGSVPIQ